MSIAASRVGLIVIGGVIAAGCSTAVPAREGTSVATSASTQALPPVAAPADPAKPRKIVVGTSVQGRPIELYLFGPEAESGARAASTTLIFAAIHGDEPSAAFVGRKLVEYLREHPEEVEGHSVGVIPIANPDGVIARTRTNANGVDCNRNFPASNWRPTRPGRNSTGPGAASEPETRAVMHAMAALRPARVISIHSPLRCNNHDGPPAALALAELMAKHNGYPVRASIGYATPGSFGTWAGIDGGIPIVTLELPPHTPGERAWAQNQAALLEAIRAPVE